MPRAKKKAPPAAGDSVSDNTRRRSKRVGSAVSVEEQPVAKAAARAAAPTISTTGAPLPPYPERRSVPPPGQNPFIPPERNVQFVEEHQQDEPPHAQQWDNSTYDSMETVKPAAKSVHAKSPPASIRAPTSIQAADDEIMQDLWESATNKLEDYEHATWIADNEDDTPWETVAQQLTQPPNPADKSQILRHWVLDNSTKTHYYLMVVNNKISVVYGLTTCPFGSSAYERVYFITGDHTKSRAGKIRPPKIMKLQRKTTEQFAEVLPRKGFLCDDDAFKSVTGQSSIPENTFLPQKAPSADDEEGVYVSTENMRAILRIPPKLACILIRLFHPQRAITLFGIMADQDPRFGVLVRWYQHAMTANSDGDSLLNCRAQVVHVTDDDDLEEWADGVVERHAPRVDAKGEQIRTRPKDLSDCTQTLTDPSSTDTSVLLQVLETVKSAIQSKPDSEESKTKTYKAFEKVALFKALGYDGPDFSGYEDTEFPPFFVDLLEHRGKAKDARAFMEDYLTTQWPSDRAEQHFLFSTPMVTAFTSLVFNGRDPQCEWGRKKDGISLFSVAAMDSDDPETRLLYENYEDDTLTHTQKDRATNQALAAKTGLMKPPTDRMSFRMHLEFFTTFLRVFFSEKCPLIQPLENIIVEMLTATATNYWRADSWKAFLWNLHVGIRFFFKTGNPARVINGWRQLQNHQDPNTANVPPELFKWGTTPTPPVVTPPGSVANPTKTNEPKKEKEKKKKEAAKKTAAPAPAAAQPQPDIPAEIQFAHHFADDISRVSTITEDNVTLQHLCPSKKARIALVGDLAKYCGENKLPCLSHFVLGKCGRGKTCTFAHGFVKDPTTAQLNAFKQRVKQSCDKLIDHVK